MKKTISRTDNSLKWIFLTKVFNPTHMNALVRLAEQTGFGQATYVDGSPRDNVQTVFFDRSKTYPLGLIFDSITEKSKHLGALFNIEVYPQKLTFLQVARYLPGDHYGQHIDHDSGLENLDYDRKLSFFCSLTDNGQLFVDKNHVNVGIGDSVIFPATMDHSAPEQINGTRYSFVAWIPGPPWT